jgi:hypothetical protein
MANLDPRIEVIREAYGLSREDFWELPQKKGTWLVKHAALELAAAKDGIAFDNPIVIEANTEAGIAVLSVCGISGNGRREWATGEASPKNNKNSYPWAMAEKRAKDRVILKLIGIHGLVYSEDEMDGDTRATASAAAAAPMSKISAYRAKQLLNVDALLASIDTMKTTKGLDDLSAEFEDGLSFLPDGWIVRFRERIEDRKRDLASGGETAPHQSEAVSALESLDREFGNVVGPEMEPVQ